MTDSGADLRAEIVECWSRYCRLMDERRQDELFQKIYAEDGILEQRLTPDSQPAVFVGQDEIVPMFLASWQHWRGTAHVLGNTEVWATREGASGTAYVSAWHWLNESPPGAPVDWMCIGRIDDDFVRAPGGWRVRRRRLTCVGSTVAIGQMPEFMNEASLHGIGR